MAVKPRSREVKLIVPLLERDYPSAEDAAREILTTAYGCYEAQASWWVVGQVKPPLGWRSATEGEDSKVVLGPFGTQKQAQLAGESLSYSSHTREEARWWPIKAFYGTPYQWWDERRKRFDRQGFMSIPPMQRRQARVDAWMEQTGGAPLPEVLELNAWEGLEFFQVWEEMTEATLDSTDLMPVVIQQQQQIKDLQRRLGLIA